MAITTLNLVNFFHDFLLVMGGEICLIGNQCLVAFLCNLIFSQTILNPV